MQIDKFQKLKIKTIILNYFILNRLNFDNIEFDIKIIDRCFYYKVLKVNKINKKYDNIREAIIAKKKIKKNYIQ